jgi:hypothetical protein
MVRILDRGLDAPDSADPESSFIVDLYVVSAVQIIIDPAVSLGWILHMDLLHLLSYKSVLPDSFSDITVQPFVVS